MSVNIHLHGADMATGNVRRINDRTVLDIELGTDRGGRHMLTLYLPACARTWLNGVVAALNQPMVQPVDEELVLGSALAGEV